jgi:hypothetical protein
VLNYIHHDRQIVTMHGCPAAARRVTDSGAGTEQSEYSVQNNQKYRIPLSHTTSQYHSQNNQKVVYTTFIPVN